MQDQEYMGVLLFVLLSFRMRGKNDKFYSQSFWPVSQDTLMNKLSCTESAVVLCNVITAVLLLRFMLSYHRQDRKKFFLYLLLLGLILSD